MTSNHADINQNNLINLEDDIMLEKMLLEKRALIAKLRNSLINSPKRKNTRDDENDEIEFLLKRF